MSRIIRVTMYGICSSAIAVGSGCNQDVTREDLSDARNEVIEERQETQVARQDAQEEINEERNETEAERQKVMRPNFDELNEEQRETQEAREEANEAIAEEEQETREAEQEANRIEAKLKAQQSRDAYLKQAQAQVHEAELRIEALEEKADGLDGAEKDAIEVQIEELHTHQERLQDEIDDMKSLDALKWQSKQAEVETAKQALAKELAETK
ncbi:hypothetical protein Pan258_44990 [Symmachiella dynata]|uniref:hypothetical protein n=1 Tax=Symmachiella dynata TaxID=2527995 RepID=UPI001187C4D4|nr:hypothetical protein [Symmachiella dynata]QDT50440.1 hypothetical protein Pan258_44990 [Symmachiella dynata]